jgi:hypothetical protein
MYTGEVLEGSDTLAVFWAFLYDHHGVREVFSDVIFGTWGDDDFTADHVTFGSRTGPVENSDHPQSTLMPGAEQGSDAAFYGRKLTRAEGLAHPLLPRFWEVNDLLLNEIPAISDHLFGSHRRWRKRS